MADGVGITPAGMANQEPAGMGMLRRIAWCSLYAHLTLAREAALEAGVSVTITPAPRGTPCDAFGFRVAR